MSICPSTHLRSTHLTSTSLTTLKYYNDGNSVEPYDGMPGYSSGEEALNAGQRANDMRIKSYEGW